MTAPTYLLQKVARHGHAIQRLNSEIERSEGEFAELDPSAAIAFDAADYVWAFVGARPKLIRYIQSGPSRFEPVGR